MSNFRTAEYLIAKPIKTNYNNSMKRLILIICLILSCILFINECVHISDEEPTDNIYASKKKTVPHDNYIPIPKELSEQYKSPSVFGAKIRTLQTFRINEQGTSILLNHK